MKSLLAQHGLKTRRVPLTHGQNVAKQILWFLCKVVIGTVLVLAFIWASFAAFL